MTAAGSGPLAGIRVIDLATERAEMAGRLLADLGAEVIKVEPPGGAAARRLPPFEAGREEDPDGSLYWMAVALGKQSVVLDIDDAAGRAQLIDLVRGADALVESFEPGVMAAKGLGYADLERVNPALVYASVTPFGQTGPEAHSPATELTIEAASGLVSLQGDGDRPPIPVGYPQSAFHGGGQAAAEIVIALNERQRSGFGQHIDVSMQTVMIWTLMNATGFPPNHGDDPPSAGDNRNGGVMQMIPGVTPRALWECADGYCTLGVSHTGTGARTFQGMVNWMKEEGAGDQEIEALDWTTWGEEVLQGRRDVTLVLRAYDLMDAFMKTRSTAELMERAVHDDMLIAPILNMEHLVNDVQLASRDYFREIGGRLHPGTWVRYTGTPIAFDQPAPKLGEHQALVGSSRTPAAPPPDHGVQRKRAFEGLKIADFAWVGVGPIISKALADHGATVVHVESATRPDVLRNAPPFKNATPALDNAQFMANFNSSKLGLAARIATPEGHDVARRLIDWADVVTESFTPGTMTKLGLDYETLRTTRPDLVMLSTCLRGQTGPQRTYGGFGGQGAALAGVHGVTGWPDRPPKGPWGAFTDFITPRFGVAAIAAAVWHQQRTGMGQHIDLSQVEASIHFVEPLVLDYTVNGKIAGPAGHESNRASPHGIYAVQGKERYIAIACETAEQWRALREIAPLDDFAEARFDRLHARLACDGQIDSALERWCADQDGWELAKRLKAAGVPASMVQRPSDLYRDPQVAHRGFFVTCDHKVMGPTPYDGLQAIHSATPGKLGPGPALGEHTEMVLTELLGYPPETVRELAAAGILQ